MKSSAATVAIPRQPARRHPLSRWYVSPVAEHFAAWLAPTRIRPVHLTIAGLLSAVGAAVVLCLWPAMHIWAAPLVLVAWFFDRADGLLARRQNTSSPWGAWFDANIDELIDVGLHVAVAAAAARLTGTQLPWFLLVAFLAGKYLFFHGLAGEQAAGTTGHTQEPSAERTGLLRRFYHLPGNTDIRIHLLVVALLTGYLTVELAVVAVYYNVRWTVRYLLVARRLGGLR